MLAVNVLQGVKEVYAVCAVEGPVLKSIETVYLPVSGVHEEFIRCKIHPFHKTGSIIDDGFSIPPRNSSRQKSGYFNILLKGEPARDRDGIGLDKLQAVV